MSEFFESLVSLVRKPTGYADEKPFQAEFFSVERLEQYAQTLAAEHKTVTRKGRAQLLPRLEDNGRKLEAAYKALVEALREGRAISPAAEWLVDNYHIVEEQLREIRQDLPKSYYHELPKLAKGELEGYPRIYAVALELIAHTDSRLDTNTLQRFIAAYQTVAPLSIGELWAVAITLRLALVENLRRLAITIARARAEREEADKLADKLLELASLQPADVMPALNERLGKREELPQTFVVQLVQRLREQHPSVMPVMDWIEKQLAKQGTSIEQIIHARTPTPGSRASHSRKHHHQHASPLHARLERLLRESQPDRAAAGTRSGRRLFANGICLARSLPARHRTHQQTNARKRARNRRSSSRSRRQQTKEAAGPKKHVGYYLIDAGLTLLENKLRLSTADRRTFASLSAATFHRHIPRHAHVHDSADHESAALHRCMPTAPVGSCWS